MFKKKQAEDSPPQTGEETGGTTVARAGNAESGARVRRRESATIGPTIRIRGEVEGEEDVTVHGRLEGSVSLRDHKLTVGDEGDVNATVSAGIIDVEGRLEGELTAAEQVVVRSTGKVMGNIKAPRVTLEDGCRFKGSIDMDVEPATKAFGSGKVADFKPMTSRSEDDTGGHKAL